MFHRDSIVSLKTGGRFIAKEYQSRHPLGDKCPHLFFSLWEIRAQANDPALHFSWHVLYLRIEFGYSLWLYRPEALSLSTALAPLNCANAINPI